MLGEGLTVKEKILLHLKDSRSTRDNLSDTSTQEGIARGIDIRRSHVPRAVKSLVEEGSLEEIMGRPSGRTRKVKMYALTSHGMRIVSEISDWMDDRKIVIRGVEETEMTLREARMAFEMTSLEIIRNLTPENVLLMPEEEEVEETEFLDRRAELAQMKSWMKGESNVMVIYGAEGFGKTQLTGRFTKSLRKRDIFWMELAEDDSTFEVFTELSEFLRVRGRKKVHKLFEEGNIDELISLLPSEMASVHSLFVLDNYFHIGEDIVDLLSHLVKESKSMKGSKLLILARAATPSYCRFYSKGHVEKGMVEEMHLKGIDERSSKILLGNPEIDDEAFKRIYLLTKGCPLYLKLISEGDEEELRRRSRFTTPEIKLLIFSRSVKSQ